MLRTDIDLNSPVIQVSAVYFHTAFHTVYGCLCLIGDVEVYVQGIFSLSIQVLAKGGQCSGYVWRTACHAEPLLPHRLYMLS